MKKFIRKIIIFFVFALIACSILPFVLWKTSMYEKFVSGRDLYYSIRESKKQNRQKKLIIGDSVADQLFPNSEKDSAFVSLACNQAIEVCGQFLLLNNYMMAGNQIDTVYLIYHPVNFGRNLNQVYTFHYFIKPFYTKEYKPYFTKTVYEQIAKIPYYRLAGMLPIRTSNWAPDFISKDAPSNRFLSPTSLEYLIRIKALADKHHFQLVFLPDPVNISMKDSIDRIDKSIIGQNGLHKEFEHYFENIIYVNDSVLFDGIHFKTEFLEQYTDLYRKKFVI